MNPKGDCYCYPDQNDDLQLLVVVLFTENFPDNVYPGSINILGR